ncbi:MAG: efflux RND transporter permease subunit [Nanobdellota archaeon]
MLKKIADIQNKYPYIIVMFAVFLTLFSVYGLLNVEFQGDMSEEMPQHLPIFQLNDKITAELGGQDTIFVLLQLDRSLELEPLHDDIRDEEILEYVSGLERRLKEESVIEDVRSVAPYYRQAGVNAFEVSPRASGFVNDAKDKMIMMIKADVGEGEEEVKSVTDMMRDHVKAMSVPSGVKVSITGNPSVIVAVINLLKKDSVYTIILAGTIILGLLFITQRSFSKGLLIFTPLLLGLIWTLGILGWLDIKISVATAGIGAMVLGLGVEYGVFMLSRYKEERKKGKSQLDSVRETVPTVGAAVMGSGSTTMVGFLALLFSVMPMMQNLGLSLAIGIFFSILAAVFVQPSLLMLEENFEVWFTHKMHDMYMNKRKRLKND